MSRSGSNGGSGLGLFSILQIVFLVLKLCNLIDWSWWWVFSPTFASIVSYGIIYFIATR